MNTLLLFIYYSIIVVLSTPSVEGKYQCDFKSVPLTCHQHTQAIGLSSIRPERRLLLTFDLSAVLGGGKYGILAPDFDYLAANQKMYVHAAMIASLLSVVIYHTMICQRRKAFAKRISTAVAAAIIAFYLAVPCIYFDSMYIKNPALRQTFALSIVIFIFRTLEAYFAYTPHGATKSLGMYVSYYIFPGEIIYNASESKEERYHLQFFETASCSRRQFTAIPSCHILITLHLAEKVCIICIQSPRELLLCCSVYAANSRIHRCNCISYVQWNLRYQGGQDDGFSSSQVTVDCRLLGATMELSCALCPQKRHLQTNTKVQICYVCISWGLPCIRPKPRVSQLYCRTP